MRWPLALLLVAACGGSQAQGSARPPLPSPDWSHPPGPEPISKVPDTQRNPECTGATFDASVLAASGLCDVEQRAQPLPQAISVTLASRAVEAVSGQLVSVTLRLHNASSEPQELFLDHSCGFENVSTMILTDSSGNRLDRVGRTDCPLDEACVGQVVHLTLLAGGEATITLPLHASVSVVGDQCEELPGRALSPGMYTVEWKTPYATTPFVTHLNVRALERLAKSECKNYAKVVAKKAEPDIRLRRDVEKQLLATCLAQQPELAFAQCRLNATTEVELASCTEIVPSP